MSDVEFYEENTGRSSNLRKNNQVRQSGGILLFFQKIGLAKSENAANTIAIIFTLIFFTAAILIYVFLS